MKHLYLVIAVLIGLCSCAKELSETSTSPAASSQTPRDKMVVLQELAESLPQQYTQGGTKTGLANKVVADIVPIKEIMTSLSIGYAGSIAATSLSRVAASGRNAAASSSSQAEDVSAVLDNIYVVNYDQDGFAILSADPRIPSVISYAESGSLTTSSEPHAGLQLVLERIPILVENRLLLDSMFEETTQYVYVDRPDLTTTTEQVAPLLTTQWWQGTPFNDRMGAACGTDYGGHYPAGCVAIAMAQLMTYYGYPATVGGLVQPWEQYRTYSTYVEAFFSPYSYNLATLVYDIGQKVNMVYSCDGSATTIQSARYGFLNYGYSNVCSVVSYSYEQIVSNLNANRPVFMQGMNYSGSNGHAWVIDGFTTENTFVEKWENTYTESGTLLSSRYIGIVPKGTNQLVHCNWGFRETPHNYCTSGLFEVRDTLTNTVIGNYSSNLKMITNLQVAVTPTLTTNLITLSGSVPNWTISAAYPAASTVSVTCSSADTAGLFTYLLPAGQSSVAVSNAYSLESITSVNPTTDATYRYTY